MPLPFVIDNENTKHSDALNELLTTRRRMYTCGWCALTC